MNVMPGVAEGMYRHKLITTEQSLRNRDLHYVYQNGCKIGTIYYGVDKFYRYRPTAGNFVSAPYVTMAALLKALSGGK